MSKKIKTLVIVPKKAMEESYEKYPVVYLLHGYGGSEKDWLKVKPNLPEIADSLGIIFVCPDGKSSWYINSPIDKSSQYETFISYELVSYIDTNYNTIADRQYRAIAGLSMGGHGALYNAFKNKEVFGAAGSTSGSVDIRVRGNLDKILGKREKNSELYQQYCVSNYIDNIGNNEIAILMDCGIDDFCFKVNELLNKELREKGIAHDYTIRPGQHNRTYWNNSIDYHLLFFVNFFKKESELQLN